MIFEKRNLLEMVGFGANSNASCRTPGIIIGYHTDTGISSTSPGVNNVINFEIRDNRRDTGSHSVVIIH